MKPLKRHEHWHTDISCTNIAGTFYYLCSVLDGRIRYIVHWEIRESMREAEVEIILHRGKAIFTERDRKLGAASPESGRCRGDGTQASPAVPDPRPSRMDIPCGV